jgi:hypothetical protein
LIDEKAPNLLKSRNLHSNIYMKKISYLLLPAVILAASILAVRADDTATVIKVSKAGDKVAKVSFEAPSKEKPVMVPVKFDDGASWDSVKDTYNVTPATAMGLEHKKVTLSFGSDGTVSYHFKK